MTTFKQVPLTCGGHTRPVVHLDFSDVTPDGFYLISACKDGKPMLRQGETGDWIGTFEGHKGAVWGVALSENANLAASGAADFSAKLWDARQGEVYFDLNKPECGPIEKINAHTNSIRHAVFLHNNRIVSVSDDLTMRVWDRTSGQEVHKTDFPTIPNSLELSRDGAILTVAHGTNVSFYSSDTMRKMREFPVPTNCYSASLAPSRATFVCGGEDLKVYKFDYNTGTELESNKGHFGPVHCVRWSPDGELYATGSEDGTVRLWQGVPGRVYGLWRRSQEPAQPMTNGFKEVAAN
ncbi:hypothetical protein ACJJTC_013397 [Scirpophaga incertulas]